MKTNDIAVAILSAVYNKPFTIPSDTLYHLQSKDLDPYLGLYSSAQIPLKITISKKNTTLIAQASGQPSFPLEAKGKHIFSFDKADVILEFNPAENSMVLKQGGGVFTFSRL